MKHIRKLTINRELHLPVYKLSDLKTREYRGFIDSFAEDSIREAQKAKKKRREESDRKSEFALDKELHLPVYKLSDFKTSEYRGFIDFFAEDSIREAQKAKKKRREEYIKKHGDSLI